jgi:hypothetical protein
MHHLGKVDIFEHKVNMAVKVFYYGELVDELNEDIVYLGAGQFHEDNEFHTGFEPIDLIPCQFEHFFDANEKEY